MKLTLTTTATALLLLVTALLKPTFGFAPISPQRQSQTCRAASIQEEMSLADLDMLLQDDALVNMHASAEHDDNDDDLMGVLLQGPESPSLTEGALALSDLVNRLVQTPPGALDADMILLLRNSMAEYAAMKDAETVERLLFRMLEEYKALSKMKRRVALATTPSDADFQLAMGTWKEAPDTTNMANNMAALFAEQQAMYCEAAVEQCKPSMATVKLVMSTLTYSRERGSDRRVYGMLEKLTTWGLSADSEIMGYVILALAKSKQHGAAERAQQMLKEAVETYELIPPMEAFNAILVSWAKSGLEDGPERAEQVLMYMSKIQVPPTIISFTCLIDAYAQTNTWEGVYQAESILNRLLEQYLVDKDSPEPNVASWTIVISAWTRLARKNNKGAAPKADSLLKRMEALQGRITCKPDAITYIQVMNAWVASKTNPERADEILNEMHLRYLDGDDDMKPSPRSVRSVVEAWVKVDTIKGMKQAEALFHRVQDIKEMQQPSEEVKDIYKTMIFGWSKLEDPFRAYEYLQQMIEKDLQPDSFCFDRIIESLTLDGGDRALQLTYHVMQTVEALRKQGSLRPNERVYTSFIRALTKRKVKGCAKQSMLILRKMQELAETDRNKLMEPTVFTYNAVLYACAESKIESDTSANMEAFKIAIGLFNELRGLEKEKADHVTYGNILRCGALLPEGNQRNALVTSTFQLACREGHVNQYVIRDLQVSAPEELWRALTQCPVGDIDWDKIPSEWKRGFERKEKKPEFASEGRSDYGRGGGRRGGGGRSGGGRSSGGRGGGRGRSERRY